MIKQREFLDDLEKLADSYSDYDNHYPYNLCYVHDNGFISADCVNLYKALFNGYNVNNRTPGYFQRDLSKTGDVTELGLLQQCSQISVDFKKLQPGIFEILYKEGHIGGYLGEEITQNGHTYNVVECTPWYGDFDGGIIYSWVDPDGTRRSHKEGTANGKWELHGIPTKWIDYKEPDPERRKIFTDIYEGDPGWREIEWCKDNGIFKGYSDGSFHPDDNIKRIDIARVLYRILKK